MKPRRRRRIAGLACIAVAGGAAVWIASAEDERPVHGWIHVEPDRSLHAYWRRTGEPTERWSVLSPWDPTLSKPLESSELLWFDAVDSVVETWLRRVGLPPQGVRSFAARLIGRDSGERAEWFEYVVWPDVFPPDAHPDPSLAGTWTMSDAGGRTFQDSDAYVLSADGTMRYDVRHAPRSAGGTVEMKSGRWGRVADVVFVDLGIAVRSDYRTNLETLVLGADRTTWRRPDGATGRLVR